MTVLLQGLFGFAFAEAHALQGQRRRSMHALNDVRTIMRINESIEGLVNAIWPFSEQSS